MNLCPTLPLLLLAALSACGKDEPKAPPNQTPSPAGKKLPPIALPPVPDVPTEKRAEGIVVTFLKAAQLGAPGAMLVTGTDAFREREKAAAADAWSARFSTGGWKVKSYRLTPAIGEGDTGTVPVYAVLTKPDGAEESKRLLFQVYEKDGVWRVAGID